ncbi:MAG: hypothetical protein GX924_07070 [Clostridiaceae bacterium]|nr:hypothetical protein [Clostridiaceae bacterium]
MSMSFLKKRLQIAEDRLAKVLHTTFEPEVREQQAQYYRDQIEDIKMQMREKGER